MWHWCCNYCFLSNWGASVLLQYEVQILSNSLKCNVTSCSRWTSQVSLVVSTVDDLKSKEGRSGKPSCCCTTPSNFSPLAFWGLMVFHDQCCRCDEKICRCGSESSRWNVCVCTFTFFLPMIFGLFDMLEITTARTWNLNIGSLMNFWWVSCTVWNAKLHA